VTVLGASEISRRLDEIFVPGTSNPTMVHAAKYYLTLGDRLLILPDNKRYFERYGSARRKPFTLKPGQTAFVSTLERLTMPLDLAGIFGPTSGLSNQGIFFFGGMLVDPGFGRGPDGTVDEDDPMPLSFYLANVGDNSLELRPGHDRIASIAFLPVEAHSDSPRRHRHWSTHPDSASPADALRLARDEIFDSNEPPSRVLGLVAEVTEVGKSLDKLEASVNQVVLFGVILLATTLVAVITSITLDKQPNVPGLSPESWLDVTKAVGVVIVEIAVLVSLFYVAVLGFAGLLGLRKRKSFISD